MRFLVFSALFMISLSAFGQQSYVSIGPRVGANFSNTVGDNIDTDGTVGLVAGVTSTISIREKTGLTIEALYSQEGAEGLLGSDFSLDYVRVPLLFNYFFRELGEPFRPKIYLGLVPGILVDADGDKDALSTFDLGLGAGLGFNYQIAERTWLNTDLRFIRGITNIQDEDNAIQVEAYNQNVQLTLGIAWGI